jgi:radical SAM protein with 4Fe4S-binding SPASM domain
MRVQQCQQVLENIQPYIEMVRVTGGEPTISPAFGDILSLLDGLGKPIVVFSNGLWRKPETVVQTLQVCRHLDGILVSLHGYSTESYRGFTGGDHFPIVLNSIRQASQAGITVNTNMILTQQNIDHLEKTLHVALDAGASVVAFSRYYGAPILGVTDLSPEQYRQAVKQATALRDRGYPVKFNNHIPLCLGGDLTQACPAGDTHCTISPDCMVRLCNHAPEIVGNLLTTPITELWASETVQNWRKQIPEPCQACQMYSFCNGGCRANALANQVEVDPLICQPFLQPMQTPALEHTLFAGAIPKVRFALRQETFGYVLINRSQILKVGYSARPFLEALQSGCYSLAEIGANFGQEALNFIGLLYDRRLLELAN